MTDTTAEDDDTLRDANDFRTLLELQPGRRFLWRWIDDVTGAFGLSYSGDPLSTAYAEGRRSIGIRLMAEAQAVSSDLYLLMLQEAMEAKKQAKLADKPEVPTDE